MGNYSQIRVCIIYFYFQLLLLFTHFKNYYEQKIAREVVRLFVFWRLILLHRVYDFFQWLEDAARDNIRGSLLMILEVSFILYLAAHIEGCLYYYIATTCEDLNNTWIGKFKVSQTNNTNFTTLPWSERYQAAIYFPMVSISTVGNSHLPLNKNFNLS